MQKSIILCSGGLNSAVLLALAKEAGPVALVHARFERPAAKREADLAAKLAGHYDVSDALVLDLPHVAALRAQLAPPSDNLAESAPRSIPANLPVPGLMSTLLSVAATAAAAAGATRIWIGLSEVAGKAPDGAQPEPAHNREFAQLMEHALAFLSPAALTLELPLMDMNRGDIVMLARRLEVPLKLTWSCWNSGEEPCQTCPGCRARARGFLDATTPDPILTRTPAATRSAAQQAAKA